MASLDVTAPSVQRSEEILTPEALAFVADLRREVPRTARRTAGGTREPARGDRAGSLDFLPETAAIRDGDWTVAPVPADLSDRRVEITGPTEREDGDQRPQLRRPGVARRPRGRQHAALAERRRRPAHAPRRRTPARIEFTSPEGKPYALADPDQIPVIVPRPRGWHFDEQHVTVDGTAGRRGAGRLRALLLPQRQGAARPRQRPVLLPPEDGVAPRGAALERRLHARPGHAGGAARHDPRDRADRDDHGGVRDGRDPLRAARPHGRAQRRPLGLPVQHHQELPRRRARRSRCPTATR